MPRAASGTISLFSRFATWWANTGTMLCTSPKRSGRPIPFLLVSLCLATKGSFLALKRCRMGSYRGSRTYVLGGFTMLLRKSPRPSNRINKVGAGAVGSGRNSLLPWSLRRGTFMRCDCSWLSTICRAIDRPAGSKRLCAMDNG